MASERSRSPRRGEPAWGSHRARGRLCIRVALGSQCRCNLELQVRIRLISGREIGSHILSPFDLVADLRDIIQQQVDRFFGFKLLYHNRTLTDDTQTLLDAGLVSPAEVVVFLEQPLKVLIPTDGGTLELYDVYSKKHEASFAVRDLKDELYPDCDAGNVGIKGLRISRGSDEYVLALSFRDWLVALISMTADLQACKVVRMFTEDGLSRPAVPSAGGHRIVTVTHHGEVRMLDRSSGAYVFSMAPHPSIVEDVAISPDGKQVASASRGAIKIHSVESARCERTLANSHQLEARRLSFSDDGCKMLACYVYAARGDGAGEDTVKVFNTSTFACEHEWVYEGVREAALSPDGSRIVGLVDDEIIILVELSNTAEPLWIYDGTPRDNVLFDGPPSHEVYNSVRFSPDGKKILVTSVGSGVLLFNASNGVCEWRQACEGAHTAAFVP